nr:hypothetical protein [Desulfurivibrio alkaliphilus]
MYRLIKGFGYPLVDAFAGGRSSGGNFGVQGRIDSNHETAGKGFFRFSAGLLAALNIKIHRFNKGLLQLSGSFAVKTNRVTNAKKVSKKNVVLGVKVYFGGVSPVFKSIHGLIPALVKKSLASRT